MKDFISLFLYYIIRNFNFISKYTIFNIIRCLNVSLLVVCTKLNLLLDISNIPNINVHPTKSNQTIRYNQVEILLLDISDIPNINVHPTKSNQTICYEEFSIPNWMSIIWM